MERIIHFEQFYYTNYGQGMRFEGDSTHSLQMEKHLELLAADWMKLDALEPVESVVYNASLRSYVAALTVPCTRVGDARTSYWIHAVLPEDRYGDGFRECLSWPFDGYQRQVQTGQELEQVKVQALFRNPQEICRSYGLTGERLVQLMYMAWQTVCGQNKPSTMYFILSGEAADNYNETARNIMSLVYDILPEQRRYQADYQAWAESDIQYVRFAFRKVSGSEWQFCLNPEQAGQAVEIPEEERTLMEILALLYEKKPEQYKIVIRELYDDATESFEDFVWQYYLKGMNNGEDFLLSQEALIRSQPYLEQRAGDSEDYRRLFCQCLNHIDTKEKTINFVQTVMEKYILAAAGLAKSDYPEYTASLVRNWQLLDQLRAGSMETAKAYLEWIRKISPEYYQHFVEQGLADGRTWLLKFLGSADNHSDRGVSSDAEADTVQMLLKDYADQGDAEGKRVEAFLDRERLDTAISSREKTDSVKWTEESRGSWAAAACVGLYMGLLVNGWYMAVHLSEILHQSMLVWGGIAGIAVLSAIFMAFAQKLVRKDISVALYQMPWAGLWLFINLALSHFIGNKITAVISGVLLLAAYIWMRLKKYL